MPEMDETTAAILDQIHGLSTVQLDLLLASIEEVKDDLRFQSWLNGVNKALAGIVPLSTEDLSGQSYRAWHEAGMTSFHAARRVLREQV